MKIKKSILLILFWVFISFLLFSQENFTFVVMGDNQPGKITGGIKQDQAFIDFLRQISRLSPRPVFFVNTGDLVHGWPHDKYEEMYKDYVRCLKEYLDPRIKHVPVVGNHDWWEPQGPQMWRRYIFPTVIDNASPRNSFYYSFDWGNSHFIILNIIVTFARRTHKWLDPIDSSRDLLSPEGKQYQWFMKDLEKSVELAKEGKLDHIFITSHFPLAYLVDGLWPFYKGKGEMFEKVEELMGKVFDKYGKYITAYFCGHWHFYYRTLYHGVPHLMTAPMACIFEQPYGHPELTFYHFLLVEVQGKKVKVKVVMVPNGEVVEEYTLSQLRKQEIPLPEEILKKRMEELRKAGKWCGPGYYHPDRTPYIIPPKEFKKLKKETKELKKSKKVNLFTLSFEEGLEALSPYPVEIKWGGSSNPQFVNGKKGKGLLLLGNEFIELGIQDLLQSLKGKAISVHFWVNFYNLDEPEQMMFRIIGGDGLTLKQMRRSGNNNIIRAGIYHEKKWYWLTADITSWKAKEWHEVEIRWYPQKRFELWLDGEQRDSCALPIIPDFVGRKVTLGCDNDYGDKLKGIMDEFGISLIKKNP